MKVSELMTENPARCTVETSLHDVAQMMVDNDCGCIPVVENENTNVPIGMITDRDITIRTVAHNKNPLNMIAGEIMSENVLTVSADTELEKCCAEMERNQVRRLAVVDENGDLCGIVAQADVARAAPPGETADLLKDISATAKTQVA